MILYAHINYSQGPNGKEHDLVLHIKGVLGHPSWLKPNLNSLLLNPYRLQAIFLFQVRLGLIDLNDASQLQI